ncbi:MAG: chemotaxis protein CheW [Vicinamibacteria bacterium]|nr:chemotaxis protein CheW [Vicinamibacteria bacterium]
MNKENAGPAESSKTRATSELFKEIEQLRSRIEELHATVSRQALADVLPAGGYGALVCRVGSERYALPLELVEHAEMMCALVSFPEAPAWAPGLLNLHGVLIPVLDIGARMARCVREPDPADLIIVCRHSEGRIGMIVQEVVRVAQFYSERIKPAPSGLQQAPYVLGVVEGEDVPVFLLSVAYLVNVSDLPELHA